MKRRREEHWLPAKRQRVGVPCLKRKNTFEMLAAPKKRRQEECGALQRQLFEAYTKIAYLEKRVQELEYVAALSRAQNYPAYNHSIECH
jgi:hypothetical protein